MIGALIWGKARQRLFLGRWCSDALQQGDAQTGKPPGALKHPCPGTHTQTSWLRVPRNGAWPLLGSLFLRCFSNNLDAQSRLRIIALWAPEMETRGCGDTCTHHTQTLDFSCKADGNMLQARQSDYLLQPTSDHFGTTHRSSLCLKKPAGLLLSYDSRLKQIRNCLIRARTIFQTYPGSSDLNITQGVWLPVPEEECIWFDCFHANEVEPVILGPHRDGWLIGCYELVL